MKKSLQIIAGLAIMLNFTACQTKTTNIDTKNDTAGAQMGLDYRDFANAAGKMISSITSSGILHSKDGKRPVLAISKIKNDTMQRIDTDQLLQKIKADLLRSGKVAVTTAIGSTTDSMTKEVRDLRKDDEFKQTTIAKKGQMIAPDLSLSGKILQKNIRMDDGRIQIEYYFQMTLTEIDTGLSYWQDEAFIGKRGDNKNISW